MHRTPVVATLAVLTHIAFVAVYGSTLGDVLGLAFLLLVVALVVPPLVRALWRLRRRAQPLLVRGPQLPAPRHVRAAVPG